MGKPLSIDLRERVFAFVETGHGRRAAARHFHVSASFAMKLMARARVTGTIEPARQGQPPGRGKLTPFAGFLGTRVDAEPDITMPELAEALFETHGVRVTPAALSRFLIREGYSYKKTLIATERGREKVRRERDAWVTHRQPWMRLEPHRLVFIDGEVLSAIGPSEAPNATTTKMTRPRGRSRRGVRLVADAPFGHWKTQTFIAGLRCHGLTAPWVLDGPMNRAAFDIYIETQLAPTLGPGDVVILDNLSSHKSAKAAKILKQRGAWFLFLPPYSPDLNPIEMAFSKLKAYLRAMKARTIDALWKAIGNIRNLYSPEKCWNYLKDAGYVPD